MAEQRWLSCLLFPLVASHCILGLSGESQLLVVEGIPMPLLQAQKPFHRGTASDALKATSPGVEVA